jgi:hypothetical protein
MQTLDNHAEIFKKMDWLTNYPQKKFKKNLIFYRIDYFCSST